jgi:predicted MFS family arabinose efflux permease
MVRRGPSVDHNAVVSEIRAATRATYAAFASAGFAFASWASRIPQVKQRLELDPAQLGLLLLALAAGAVIALPLSGAVVGRFGSRRTVATMAVLGGAGLVIVALGYRIGVAPVVVGLFMFGMATGTWDVAMNIQGAAIERGLGSAIMSRFHAGFSVGTVAGALSASAIVALEIGVTAHLLAVGLVIAIGVPFAVQAFVPDHDEDERPAARDSLTAWREPRTLLIGVFVLAFAFSEGAGNDWISVATIEGYGADPVVGTLALAAFLTAMTAGRWTGPALLDRYGRVPVIRALIVVALAGVALFACGPSTPLAFAGVLLWGAGVSLGFPVGMSAGADQPALAAPRVGVISTIGYCAFLAGPPLVGFLAQHSTVLHALGAVLVLLALAGALTGSVRPLRA